MTDRVMNLLPPLRNPDVMTNMGFPAPAEETESPPPPVPAAAPAARPEPKPRPVKAAAAATPTGRGYERVPVVDNLRPSKVRVSAFITNQRHHLVKKGAVERNVKIDRFITDAIDEALRALGLLAADE